MPSRIKEIMGEIRVHEKSNWENVPKKNWSIIPSIGFLYYRIDIDNESGRIRDIFVIERFQKTGIGSRLIEIAEGRMKVYGVKEITGSAVVESRDFWRRRGYTVTDGEMKKEVVYV